MQKKISYFLKILGAFFVATLFLAGCSNKMIDVPTQTTQDEVKVVFDLPALTGKNIDEVRQILGTPTDGGSTEPNASQIEMGTVEWSNSFEKKGYELMITYNIKDRSVIDFFLATNDTSGATKDIESLKRALNLNSSEIYDIEPVEVINNPSEFTGIIVKLKNDVHITEQHEVDYEIIESTDISYALAKRFSIKVVIKDTLVTEEPIKNISKKIVEDYKNRADAIAIFFYSDKSEVEDAYTLAKAEWAPNGDWSQADLKKNQKLIYNFTDMVGKE